MNIPVIPNNHYISGIDPIRDVSSKRNNGVSQKLDKVTIGEESKIVSQMLSKLREIQDSRRPDIERLKQQILSGNYRPSAEEVARAILFGPPVKK